MTNSFIIFIVVCSVVLGGSYSLWLANRILFGNIKYYYSYKFFDLTIKEFFILFNLAFFVFFFGIFPFFFLQYIHKSVIFYILCFLN